MLGRTYDGQNCSVARALESVGERWSLLIIRDALLRGITRFSDFQRSLAIAPNILATRLEGFVDAGLMQTRPHPDRPGQHDYLLTDKGRDLAPVILALTHWGDRWAAPQGPPVSYEHHGCGGAVHQQIHCDICGHIPTSADMIARPNS
ncbi:MAG: hypothetical protein QOE61_2479 [Micromonosporaceae bacterium]|jgi:DNA-binding HxlR family transcriptional regulator|nr:hypothetical protein [Micromonosporaceae bacterium]